MLTVKQQKDLISLTKELDEKIAKLEKVLGAQAWIIRYLLNLAKSVIPKKVYKQIHDKYNVVNNSIYERFNLN